MNDVISSAWKVLLNLYELDHDLCYILHRHYFTCIGLCRLVSLYVTYLRLYREKGIGKRML